jgi:hypothetical protein
MSHNHYRQIRLASTMLCPSRAQPVSPHKVGMLAGDGKAGFTGASDPLARLHGPYN